MARSNEMSMSIANANALYGHPKGNSKAVDFSREEYSFVTGVSTFCKSLAAVFVIFVLVAAEGANYFAPFLPFEVGMGIGLFGTLCFFPAVGFLLIGVLGGPTSWITLAKETIDYWLEFKEKGIIFGLFISGPAKMFGNFLQIVFPPASLMFQEPCVLYGIDPIEFREGKSHPNEHWIMINGVATTYDVAVRNRKQLFKMFGRAVTMVHNPTQSVFLDLVECITGKVALFESNGVKPREVLYDHLTNYLMVLYEKHKKGEPQEIILISHSQGTIVTGNVLDKLYKEGGEEIQNAMKEMLYVFNFATCAHKMPGDKCKHLENISNTGDFVGYLGVLFPEKLRPYWKDAKNEPMEIKGGKKIIQPGRWGHLLNAHYLIPMEEDRNLYKDSLLRDLNKNKRVTDVFKQKIN